MEEFAGQLEGSEGQLEGSKVHSERSELESFDDQPEGSEPVGSLGRAQSPLERGLSLSE